MSRRKQDNGKISVKAFVKTVQAGSGDKILGVGDTFKDSQKTRSTENDALATRWPTQLRLSKFQKRLLLLDQIALNPKTYPEEQVHNRPARPINQPQARFLWIGSQPDMKHLNWKDIAAFFDQCEALIVAQLRAENEE